MISIANPIKRTTIVFLLQPFHSFRIMPQILEKVTFRAIRMHQLKVSRTALPARKPLPRLKPKNWLYHNRPARAQNRRLCFQSLPCP